MTCNLTFGGNSLYFDCASKSHCYTVVLLQQILEARNSRFKYISLQTPVLRTVAKSGFIDTWGFQDLYSFKYLLWFTALGSLSGLSSSPLQGLWADSSLTNCTNQSATWIEIKWPLAP